MIYTIVCNFIKWLGLRTLQADTQVRFESMCEFDLNGLHYEVVKEITRYHYPHDICRIPRRDYVDKVTDYRYYIDGKEVKFDR